jgi:hypothetical protein
VTTQIDLFVKKSAGKNALAIKVMTPLALELARKAGEAGVTVADLRIVGRQRGLLPRSRVRDRSLSWLGAVMRAAGLKATARTRRSTVIEESHGNRHVVWVLPEFAQQQRGGAA